MKPLTTAQTACALLAILLAWAFMSHLAFKELAEQERFDVEAIMAKAKEDELNKPREALNRLQEDAETMLALQEVR